MGFNALRPFIAPAIAPFIGAFLAYLANRFGIQYTPEQQAQISEGVVTAILALFATAASLTGIAKVAMNRKLNPGNAASSGLAAREKHEANVLDAKAQADE
jgi:hypothetical protein